MFYFNIYYQQGVIQDFAVEVIVINREFSIVEGFAINQDTILNDLLLYILFTNLYIFIYCSLLFLCFLIYLSVCPCILINK